MMTQKSPEQWQKISINAEYALKCTVSDGIMRIIIVDQIGRGLLSPFCVQYVYLTVPFFDSVEVMYSYL